MAITIKQECITRNNVAHVDVPSESEPTKTYSVYLLGDNGICDCPDYRYRSNHSCKHIQKARKEERCGWIEGAHGRMMQSPRQELARVCPECGSDTKLVAYEE